MTDDTTTVRGSYLPNADDPIPTTPIAPCAWASLPPSTVALRSAV
ncbi:hypothetical protein [Cutibacterium modestum]|uniref:Uncharacterized protein n=1 Tax=Cutibacterium modestum HL044PA1 TaxID=765109 RepID=A0ABP2K9Q8_9ACTN|nr:hypothetical protein [Cutibacterium modestum]EFS92802.1 hypothetical protein HMPREF9607_01018 [Cutibacterium modestum HL044PA1]